MEAVNAVTLPHRRTIFSLTQHIVCQAAFNTISAHIHKPKKLLQNVTQQREEQAAHIGFFLQTQVVARICPKPPDTLHMEKGA